MSGNAQAQQQQSTEGNSVSSALIGLQTQALVQIASAISAGDMAAVERLIADLAKQTRELIGAPPPEAPKLAVVPEAKPEEPPPRQFYDNSLCELDLSLTVYDGDRDMYASLVDDPHFARASSELLADAKPYNARKALLKSALKLTPKLAPKVFDTLARCRRNIGLIADIELYVVPDVDFNAFCYPPAGGKFIIGVTSALLEKFTDDELAFVLGHEIGHALFGHHKLPVGFLLHYGHELMTPLHAMRLYAWKRNCEISCDRVGLICGRDFNAAASAFFKLSSGVTNDSLSFELKEYISQFTDLESEMGASEDVDPEDWYSTHPFSPMRIKALDMFARSQTFGKIIGDDSPRELTEQQLEADIKKIMSVMEPTYLQESSELATLMKDYVFYGGFLVAAANGTIDESEIVALGSLLDPKEVRERIETMKNADIDEIKGKVVAIADKLDIMIPVVSKLNVIKDLTIIAGADGSVEDSELEILYGIANSLGIRGEFVDHVLSTAGDEDEGDG